MRKFLVALWLVFLFSVIGVLFWYNEWVYHLPTPIPENYKPVDQGRLIRLNGIAEAGHSKPVFLHFFNPDCPCSRFNMANFKSLVKRYGRQVNFVIVVMNNKLYTAKAIQDKFDLDLPVLFDPSIAASCGVYSTPQAVLLDEDHKLYYRGNYNSSRYCTDEKTNYARIAITGLLHDHQKIIFNQLALRAYGCQLPNCTK
ncbi:MAG TPA: redoxin domain-containing protein [Mucilaginibacter sp.]|nr:redoxin domain-containing protein [Mucilaginibacter sp.]